MNTTTRQPGTQSAGMDEFDMEAMKDAGAIRKFRREFQTCLRKGSQLKGEPKVPNVLDLVNASLNSR